MLKKNYVHPIFFDAVAVSCGLRGKIVISSVAMAHLNERFDDACYTDGAWLDYARGLQAAEVVERMQAHVQAGCSRCELTSAVWAHALKAARADAGYMPPAALVNAVKKAFHVKQRLPFLDSLAVGARVVLDSFRTPLPAGIRAAAAFGPRHLVHEAGEILVDIQIETAAGRPMCLTGQVSYRDGNSGLVSGTQVFLTRGAEGVVRLAVANEFGEFTLDTDSGLSELDLFCLLPAGDMVRVSLP